MKDPEELEAYGRYLALVGEAWLLPPTPSHLAALGALAELFGEPDLQVAHGDRLKQTWEYHFRVPGEQNLQPYKSEHANPGGHEVRVEVASLYQQAGFSTSPYEHEPPDHIGHELRFISALVMRQASCHRQGERAAAVALGSWIAGFIRDHVLGFLDVWVGRVEQKGMDPFFPALARVSSRLVWGVYEESESDSGVFAPGKSGSLPPHPNP